MRLIMLLVMYNYLSFSCQNAIINCKFTICGYIMSKCLDICISRSLKNVFIIKYNYDKHSSPVCTTIITNQGSFTGNAFVHQ